MALRRHAREDRGALALAARQPTWGATSRRQIMKNRAHWKKNGRRLGTALTVMAALLAASGGVLRADSDSPDDRDRLVGTWTVQVTLRDCATNAAIAPPFDSLVTFHDGGTLSESTVSFPGERTSGHGTWSRHGWHVYRAAVDCPHALRYRGQPAWHSRLQPGAADRPALLRGLVNGHPHSQPLRSQASHVGWNKRVLYVRWHGVQDRLLHRRRSALRITHR